MDILNELGDIFAVGASIGAILGYTSGWIIAIRGGKTRYFQELAHRSASSGMTRNQFACSVGIKLALSFGILAVIIGCIALFFFR